MPGTPSAIHCGEFGGLGLLVGMCARCEAAHRRLPASTVRRRMTAAGVLAAGDVTGRYYVARFCDPGAAQLAVGLLNTAHAGEVANILGWR
jgi:hypothetical protein